MSTIETGAYLTISARPKGIPYPGIGKYEDGAVRYAFKPLKGRPEETAKIYEAQDDAPLMDLLLAFNDELTGVFTIGCEKSFNHDEERGHWAKGYVEFAINDKRLVVDAQHYFKIFWVFNDFMHKQKFNEPVTFHWELEPAEFQDAAVVGITAAVWGNSASATKRDEGARSVAEGADISDNRRVRRATAA